MSSAAQAPDLALRRSSARGRLRRSRVVRALRRNPLALAALVVILAMVVAAVFAPLLAPYSPTQANPADTFAPPSAQHLLGTDALGYDILSRLIYGARVSLAVAVLSVALAVVVGVPLGALSGYYRGFVGDHAIMRVADAFQSLPSLILALGVTAALGRSLTAASIAIGVSFAPHFLRVTRAQVLIARRTQFVEAAIVAGAGDLRILRKHVLPSAVGPIIIQATVAMGTAMLLEAALSFLGLGVRPPTASWGADLRAAQSFLFEDAWLAICPGLAIFIAVLAFNIFGDGLRDALDPRGQDAVRSGG